MQPCVNDAKAGSLNWALVGYGVFYGNNCLISISLPTSLRSYSRRRDKGKSKRAKALKKQQVYAHLSDRDDSIIEKLEVYREQQNAHKEEAQ